MNKKEIKQLADRYFEGLTTDAEERRLCRFLASTEADAPEWEELKAVMGFVLTGRQIHQSARKQTSVRWTHPAVRWVAAASVVLLLSGGYGLYRWTRPTDICVAYINGKECTDTGIVLQHMEQSMQAVLQASDRADERVQAGLRDLFRMENHPDMEITTSSQE